MTTPTSVTPPIGNPWHPNDHGLSSDLRDGRVRRRGDGMLGFCAAASLVAGAAFDVAFGGVEVAAVWLAVLPLLGAAVLDPRPVLALCVAATLGVAGVLWLKEGDASLLWPHAVPLATSATAAWAWSHRRRSLRHRLCEQIESLETRLRASGQALGFFEHLLDSSRDAIFVVDDKGLVLFGEDHVRRVVGLPATPASDARLLLPRIPPERRAVPDGTEGDDLALYRFTGRGGSVRWFETSTHRTSGVGGYEGKVVVLRDVTQRVAKEAERHRLQDRYRQLFETLDEAVFVNDLSGRVLMANPRFEEMLGLEPGSAVETNVSGLHHPEDYPAFAATHHRVVNGDRGTVHGRVRHADGHYVEVKATSVLTDAYGEPALLNIMTDLSDLRDLQQRNADAARRHQNLVESLNDGVVVNAADGRMLYCNPRFAQMLGYDHPDGVLAAARAGEPFPGAPPEPAAALDGAPGQERAPVHLYRRDGSRISVQVRTSRTDAFGKGSVLVVYNDVTDLEESRRAALEAQRDAERANEAKTLMLSRVSHELRTPLSPIIGYADLLRRTRPPSEVRMYAERILGSAEQLLHITDDLLDLSRVERGVLEVRPRVTALRPLCTQAIEQTRSLAGSLGLQVVLEGPDCLAIVDPHRMRQVLANLLTNALRHGGTDVELHLEPGPGEVRCMVVDHGPGIAGPDVERVFEPFVRLGGDRSGTGLGLSLVRSLVQAIGGSVTLSKTPGGGSTFTVVVPAG